MNFITKKALSRRTILRGIGATVALPVLDSMIPALKAQVAQAPPRLGFVYASHGVIFDQWKPTKIGKGYAMAWGVTHLKANPPDLVLFVDADCRLQEDFVRRMKLVCQSVRRPVQAFYLMHSAEDSSVNHSLAEFAWILKNWARPIF